MKRIAAMIFVLVGLALCCTGPAIFSRPIDGISVAWFIVLGLTSAAAAVGAVSALISQYTRFQMRTSLDGFFWIVFLILPIAIGLLATAAWTLAWYFLGLEIY
ncbi:hypothetical protein [Mesorhizobium sp. B4-1-1]|uniref:hypothetical protein n=1 Tax=Mesorhizobium sp. B4-1-1 TaxID=2589890 RepID=UPI0011292F98|nr:hypothetical protein [Mesorhizobium sp. B4-1-1]TPI20142.1 hypothetical protein FJW10_12445 [Mesorhizobium sp. B4-1-1]